MTNWAVGDMMNDVIFVSEFTTNHLGSLNLLLRMTQEAAQAGCDYIKMQKKSVSTFYSAQELSRPYRSPYGKTFGEYRTMFEFDRESHNRFDRECRFLKIPWFATVQDVPSLKWMIPYDLPMYKLSSSSARNPGLLREVAQTVPLSAAIVISVAGATLSEIETALSIVNRHTVHLLHCVAEYPCPVDSLRLGNITVLKQMFESDRVTIGYSGHERGIQPTLAAVELGARMIERHFCISRHSFVHHIECSLEPQEFAELISVVRSEKQLTDRYTELPNTAFKVEFGMSDAERRFLINRQYAKKA
jgi:sialic acid synthase SpsE